MYQINKSMMKQSLILILLILELTLMSCTSEVSEEHVKQIIPLNVGNMWVYNSTRYGVYEVSLESWVDTTKVIADSNFNNVKWSVINKKDKYSEATLIATNNASGYYEYYNLGYPSDKRLLFKFPGKVNDQTPIYVIENDSIYTSLRRIVSIDTTIIISAKTFSCYLYHTPRIDLKDSGYIQESDIFICPDVGIVKKIYYENYSNVRYIYMRSELINYSNKP
jgi:hypothetical protein